MLTDPLHSYRLSSYCVVRFYANPEGLSIIFLPNYRCLSPSLSAPGSAFPETDCKNRSALHNFPYRTSSAHTCWRPLQILHPVPVPFSSEDWYRKNAKVINPHFKWGFGFNPSGVVPGFRQRRDFAVPFILVAS